MLRLLKINSVLLALALLAGCASGGGARQMASGQALPAPDTTNAAGAYEGASDYRLGPQDLIEVSVFGVEELNKTVRVNSNGQISLPLVGGVMAGGRTIPELEGDLAKSTPRVSCSARRSPSSSRNSPASASPWKGRWRSRASIH